MVKKRIFLTGASGSMGYAGLTELLKHRDKFDITCLILPTRHSSAPAAWMGVG